MFADDRSPLQRLELTLDSITKEEKRARLEAAENRIREREAREGGRHQTRDVGGQQAAPGPAPSQAQGSQQQVRFRDGGEDESEEKARQKAARERPVSLHAYKGPLSQNPPDEGRRYPSGPSSTAEGKRAAAAPAGSDLPKRNLSFRERAARTSDLRLPNGADAGPLVQDSPVTTPPAGVFQITRTGSNKLRKDPPGDLWQSKRKETEKKYPHAQVPRGNSLDEAQRPGEAPRVPQARGSAAVRTSVSVRAKPGPPVIHDASAETGPSTKTRGAPPRQPVYQDDGDDEEDSLEELEISVGARPPPRASASQRKPDKVLGPGALAAAAAGAGAEAAEGLSAGRKAPAAQTGPTRPHPPPQQAAEAPPALKGQAAGVHHRRRVEGDPDTSSDDRSERSESHHHRVSNLVYRAREKMQPGQGMYKPPKYLDEWKKGTVGTLSGALLDLTEDLSLPGPSAGVDKDKAWWEGAPLSKRRASLGSRPKRAEAFDGEYEETATRFKPALYLKCGPLLRFCGIKHERAAARQSASRSGTGPADREIWRGTIMIVTQDSDSDYTIAPTLRLFIQPLELLPPHPDVVEDELPPEYVDPIAGHPKIGRRGETLYVKPVDLLEEARDLSRIETEDGLFESTPSPITADPSGADAPGTFANRRKRIEVDGEKVGKYKDVRGFRLHAERGCTFWRFNVEVELRERQQRVAYRINRGPSMGFWVPAAGEAMNIMFYSCNGFSLSVNSNEFCGPDPMWRDVLNTHQSRPFHVMVGGGDQIYNDAAMVQTRLFREWLSIKNPLQKHNAPFTAEMQDELEAFYLERYAMWFSQGLFGLANSQIPMVNMFDDHDIIDGFGSYPHHFMNTPVFSGLGAVAFKYYMLFQHQSVVDELEANEPSWTLGVQPGPYINELSRSIFMSLGGRVALLAVDCRTERTRDEVVCEATWKKLMDRCYDEIVRGQLDHLLVLLGVPIAYPRLVWLENMWVLLFLTEFYMTMLTDGCYSLTSRLLDPIKALGKTGLLGNFLNKFDGGVEVLDDLDDHWTAKNHKHERQIVIEDLQDLAADKSVRVTILRYV